NLQQLTLKLWFSPVTILEPLQGLANLEQLQLTLYRTGRRVESLERLTLSPLKDLANLQQLTLNLELKLWLSPVTSLGPLRERPQLKQLALHLRDSQVKSLEPLKDLANLQQLTLDVGRSVKDERAYSLLAHLRQIRKDMGGVAVPRQQRPLRR